MIETIKHIQNLIYKESTKMKYILMKLLPYIIVFTVLFYGVGFLAPFEIAPIILLLFNPLTIFVAGIIYSIKHGFKWYFLLLIPVLFIPSVFLFYNDTALFYAAFYLIILSISMGVGSLIKAAM